MAARKRRRRHPKGKRVKAMIAAGAWWVGSKWCSECGAIYFFEDGKWFWRYPDAGEEG